MTTYKQLRTPNLNIRATSSWCLQYVDDTVNAPIRAKSAQAEYDRLKVSGQTRGGMPPAGVWVPIWFALIGGKQSGLGHVAWAYNHGNGRMEIHDSEVHSGSHSVFHSIQEVERWTFRGTRKPYLGWSISVGGVNIVAEINNPSSRQIPAPQIPRNVPRPRQFAPSPQRRAQPAGNGGTAPGLYRVNHTSALNVHSQPRANAPIVARYTNGQTVNIQSVTRDGWGTYRAHGGQMRFIPMGGLRRV